MKTCKGCGKIKEFSDFYRRSDRKSYQSKCKLCQFHRQKAYKARPETKELQKTSRAAWQAERMRKEIESLGDQYIKKLLVNKTSISWKLIPDELVAIKRLQIEIQRFIKENHA